MNEEMRKKIEDAVEEYDNRRFEAARAEYRDVRSSYLCITEDGAVAEEFNEALRMETIGARFNLKAAYSNLLNLLLEKEATDGNQISASRSE